MICRGYGYGYRKKGFAIQVTLERHTWRTIDDREKKIGYKSSGLMCGIGLSFLLKISFDCLEIRL